MTEIKAGNRIGSLTVLGFSQTKIYKRGGKRAGELVYVDKWFCRCDCGREREIGESKLKCSKIEYLNCGCAGRNRQKLAVTTHGASKSSEYRAWDHMKQRCYNPNYPRYSDWGGRGIKVYEGWINSFQEFYKYIGPKPEPKNIYSIDRIDNNLGYVPGNVRWATAKEQANNRGVRASEMAKKNMVPIEKSR